MTPNIVSLFQRYYNAKKQSFPNFSYGYLSEQLGVSKSLLSKFFKGERVLAPRILIRLMELLEIDLETQDLITNLLLKDQGWSDDVVRKKA